MSAAEKIFEEARRLPEPLAEEVLDFIAFLNARHGLLEQTFEHWKAAQQPVMEHIWANPDDDVWNAL